MPSGAIPPRRFVVLLGAVHTNRLKGVPYAGVNSVASLLAPEVESLTTLSTSALGGAAWACLPGGSGCGPLPFPPSNEQRTARGAGVYLSGELQDYDGLENLKGYDGLIVFARATPAEPAVPTPAQAPR
jgi:hypothetical protein